MMALALYNLVLVIVLRSIPSEVKVHQSDPLGPALFPWAIHPILNNLQDYNTEITALAYPDDL